MSFSNEQRRPCARRVDRNELRWSNTALKLPKFLPSNLENSLKSKDIELQTFFVDSSTNTPVDDSVSQSTEFRDTVYRAKKDFVKKYNSVYAKQRNLFNKTVLLYATACLMVYVADKAEDMRDGLLLLEKSSKSLLRISETMSRLETEVVQMEVTVIIRKDSFNSEPFFEISKAPPCA